MINGQICDLLHFVAALEGMFLLTMLKQKQSH